MTLLATAAAVAAPASATAATALPDCHPGSPIICRLHRHHAETQQAPSKPFIKLDLATGPLVLGFEALADRDDARDLLKQLMPPPPGSGGGAKPAGGASAQSAGGSPGAAAGGAGGGKLLVPSAQQAAALFRDDKDLESVYRSLVVSGILTEADFWRARQGHLRDALAPGGVLAGGSGPGGGGSSGGGGAPRGRRQRVGLPSAMLADVKPSADGQTEKVHFQLTPQIIQQVCRAACVCCVVR